MPEQTLMETTALNAPPQSQELRRPHQGLPLIAIAGASGKTSTGWMLIQLLELAGNEVAAWLTDGVYVDHTLRLDELHAWEFAAYAARAREIDILVQEIPAVLATNLPENSAWIAVLTSICGSDGQCRRDPAASRDQAAVEAVSAAVQRGGRVVANADDRLIVDAAAAASKRTIYYALSGANPVLRSHVEHGGDAVWIHNGWVKAQIAGSMFRLARDVELPSTLNGHLLFQAQNALAAIATMVAINNNDGALPRALTHWNSMISLSGVSVHSEHDRTIIFDNPGSLYAVKQLVRGIRSYGPKRVVQVIGQLDALNDVEASEASRILGSLGGVAIILSDTEHDERVDQITSGLMLSDNPPVTLIRGGNELSLDDIRSMLGAGDVALILSDAV